VVSVTPRPYFTPGKEAVPIVQEAGWAPVPVWTGAENLARTGIRLISRPIHAPSHELEDTDTNTTLTKVISKRIFVELLCIREGSVILYLWGMNPLA
jgi:hypothetical protein